MQVTTTNNKYSAKYYPDPIIRWERNGNSFLFYTSETILELLVLSDRIIRFRYASDGNFQRDHSYALWDRFEESLIQLAIIETDTHYIVSTSLVDAEIAKSDLKVAMYDRQHQLIVADSAGFHWMHYLWKGGKIVFVSKHIQEGEQFFGLGDKPTGINLRGKRFENYGTDAYGYGIDTDPLYKNIPFYYGLHHGIGYGIFFDNTFRTIFDFGKENQETASYWARGGQMNYYFIYGPQLLTVAQSYARLTGMPELPPLWALGYQQSRWSYFPDTKVMEIAKEFRNRNIPCDAIHLDIDYMEGFRCFTFSKEYFPQPKKLTDDLSAMGMKTVVIIDPGIKVDPEYEVYKSGLIANVFCKRQDGALMEGDVWPGKCVFPDYTNPETRKWWSSQFKVLSENGIRGVWNDMNEPAVFEIGTFPEDVRHDYDGDPCSHRKAHNVYGHLMAMSTYQGLKKYSMPHRPFVITRSAYAGIQKYSCVWTGDNSASWEHLWLAAQQILSLSVSGVSFAGSDVGGFIGEPDGELYTRWVQMAAFHPFFRSHSASNETGFNQEPWSFGPFYERICKKAIQLRYRLLPYFYTTFWQNSRYGTPMIRPLGFYDQTDPFAVSNQNQFLVGDHVLVAPVYSPGQTETEVYLPNGNWYYNWDDKKHEGKNSIRVQSPIEQIPVFIKEGAVIPSWPQMNYVGEKHIKEITLNVYYKEGLETSQLYFDDGDNFGYKNGRYKIVTFELQGNKSSLKIWKNKMGDYKTAHEKYKLIITGLPFSCSEYIIDGRTHKLTPRNFALGKVKFSLDKNFHEILIR
jgi:alpha-glucosidase